MKAQVLRFVQQIHAKDILWTDLYLSKTPFHAGFWVRRRIDKAIAEHSHLASGVLFDLGCGIKPYQNVFAPHIERYWGMEYSPESGYRGNAADFCGDGADIPLPALSVDTVLCTEVMEHVPHPEKVIAEVARILKPNGVAIFTAPFFYPIHDKFDFFRYSPDGLAAIMKRHDLIVEKVLPLSGGGVTLAAMFNIYWYDLGFTWTKWLYPFGVLLRPLLLFIIFIINIMGWLGEKLVPSPQMSFNHLTVARKNSDNLTNLD